jgi:isopentenyl phosphate kinase
MSLDLNPIEHIWDMLGCCIHAQEPPVHNIRQLEAALHREWQQLSQLDIRCLTGGMRRRVEAVIEVRGVTPGTELCAQEVPEPIYDVLTCSKYALWDSNPGTWLAVIHK